jgi:hypothetical protein
MRPWLSAGLVIAATLFVRVVFTREEARKRMFPVLRPLYKHVFNPRVLHAATRGQTSWGVIHYVGRRTGATYATPIDAQPTRDGVVIPVVYGDRADWCRNVLAAGRCTLTLNRQELVLSEPQFVCIADVQAQLAPDKARFWRSIGIEHCLSLKSTASEIGPSPEEAMTARVDRAARTGALA